MSATNSVIVAALSSLWIAAGSLAAGCGGTDSSLAGDGSDGGNGADATSGDSGTAGDGSSGTDGSSSDSGASCGTACTAFADGGAFPTFDDRADSV
ncbi:MAG: hypothetical protein ACRELY_02675, partial [Polyangiaceae bacterium]